MIGEKEGAWLMCHWGTRRKGRRPASFTSEIANMNTNEIVFFRIERKGTTSIPFYYVYNIRVLSLSSSGEDIVFSCRRHGFDSRKG
jgi:hypothetical protein